MNKVIKEYLAYIAGFIDGEGCLGIKLAIDSKNYENFKLHIGITNTNKEALEKINKKLSIGYIRLKSKATIKHKAIYLLELRKYEFKELLLQIIPYLENKKYQALILLEWFKEIKPYNYDKIQFNYKRRIDVDINALKHILYETITLLNKKGPYTIEELEEIKSIKRYYDSIYNELIEWANNGLHKTT